ncbi:probable carboxylesterase 15 [Phtheirospermum japonicum]|uniref:Probable carboxylesterase 15 n=1 Tax=Phtheirospermum japonicum TaxID=374723 RepID=A0A830CIH3_9LAMI|nr:probable carboxylesterase 15 [Phtheirospermum japonicum]
MGDIVEDCQGLIQLLSDGSIVRSDPNIRLPRIHVDDDGSALWKDCLYDERHNLHLRLYKPRSPPHAANLPVLYFLHGGGFCLGSRTSPRFHGFCLRLASALQGAGGGGRTTASRRSTGSPPPWTTPPAPFKWLQGQAVLADGADEWLRGGSVDFGRVFIVGDSSGGNLATTWRWSSAADRQVWSRFGFGVTC